MSRQAYRRAIQDLRDYVQSLEEVAEAAKWLRDEQKQVCQGHDARELVCRCEQIRQDIGLATDLLDKALFAVKGEVGM
jgi:hypothetical protein